MRDSNTLPRSHIQGPVRWLVIGEVLLLALAVPLALGWAAAGWPRLLSGGLGFGLIGVLGINALGLHALRNRSSLGQRLIKYASGAALATLVLWLLLSLSGVAPVPVFRVGFAVLVSFAGLIVWRSGVERLVDSPAIRRQVLILGAGDNAARLAEACRRRSDRRGLDLVGFLPVSGESANGIAPARQLHGRTDVRALCQRYQVAEIVLASDRRLPPAVLSALLECRQRGVAITRAPTFIEREFGRIPIELLEAEWWLDRGGFSASRSQILIKRGFDLLASVLLLIPAAPLMLFCALAIKLEDGWQAPVLFRQERTGLGGRSFQLFKFRSMRTDAEGDGVARWARSNDDRVTRVGRLMRKTRLDELPQLVNVLRGEMSLVGPRPERPPFVQQLAGEIPYYDWRHNVRPGITGWAQLCYPYGASVHDAREKLKYDLYYVKNHTLGFDLSILLRTVEVVLFGKGAR